jgi:hypothetical protein
MRFVPTYLCTLLITFLCSCATLDEQPAIPNLATADDQTGIAGLVTNNQHQRLRNRCLRIRLPQHAQQLARAS